MISTEHNRTNVCASKMSNEILIRFVFCHRRLFSNFQLSIIGSCVCWWCEKWKCATSVTHKGMRTNPQRMVSTPYGMLKCIAIEEVGLKRQYQMLFGTELIFKHTKPSCITMLGCVACIFCCSTTLQSFLMYYRFLYCTNSSRWLHVWHGRQPNWCNFSYDNSSIKLVEKDSGF